MKIPFALAIALIVLICAGCGFSSPEPENFYPKEAKMIIINEGIEASNLEPLASALEGRFFLPGEVNFRITAVKNHNTSEIPDKIESLDFSYDIPTPENGVEVYLDGELVEDVSVSIIPNAVKEGMSTLSVSLTRKSRDNFAINVIYGEKPSGEFIEVKKTSVFFFSPEGGCLYDIYDTSTKVIVYE
jgi:hypothetical protein